MTKDEKKFKFKTRIYRKKDSPSEEAVFFGSFPFFSIISKSLGIKEGDEVIIIIKTK